MIKDYVLDTIGNKVHVGDEVIYIEYKAPITKKNIFKVIKLVSEYSVRVDSSWVSKYTGNLIHQEQTINRFLKVIRENKGETND